MVDAGSAGRCTAGEEKNAMTVDAGDPKTAAMGANRGGVRRRAKRRPIRYAPLGTVRRFNKMLMDLSETLPLVAAAVSTYQRRSPDATLAARRSFEATARRLRVNAAMFRTILDMAEESVDEALAALPGSGAPAGEE